MTTAAGGTGQTSPSLDPASFQAWRALPAGAATLTSPSAWRSVLVRGYDEPAQAEPFTTTPTDDVLLVLQRSGTYRIESLREGRWRGADYRPGSMGLTAPGVVSVLRWQPLTAAAGAVPAPGPSPAARTLTGAAVRTVQIHVAATVVEEAARALGYAHWSPQDHLDVLELDEPAVRATAQALSAAAQAQAPPLAAEALTEALAAQLVHAAAGGRGAAARRAGRADGVTPLSDRQVRRVVDHLRANLDQPVGLQECADLLGVSRSHFLRAFAAATGCTPHRYLVRLRMDRGARLLRSTDLTVLDVAVRCGYAGTSHFAGVFARVHGAPPTDYRRRHRRPAPGS